MSDTKNPPIRVRIPPSPTGPLHFGTARMALYNWLFARQNNGQVVFRPEDTDRERSKPEFEKDIVDGLHWFGISWDEGPDVGGPYGPYRQSERTDIYEKYLKQLINEDKAYYCFCTKEELEQDKEAMVSQGLAPKYSGKCRGLDIKQSEARVQNGEKAVIRLKVPDVVVDFNDMIRGKIAFDMKLTGDFVIAKDIRTALYAIAGVIDDYEMKVSHVIRGEDIISSTPKQIVLQRALGFNEVKYAHLPLILNSDRSKLSKRHLETSLNDYKREGYLPDAIINFIALLGWHPVDDKEILSKEELLKQFDLKRVQKSGAVFNIEKLEWINAQHLKKLSDEDIYDKLVEFIPEEWKNKKELIFKILKVEKERMKKLSDFKVNAEFFINLPDYDPKILIWKDMTADQVVGNLKVVEEKLSQADEIDFNDEALQNLLNSSFEVYGKGQLLWPLRVALSGKNMSPGPFEIMEVLGKAETLNRIKAAINKIS